MQNRAPRVGIQREIRDGEPGVGKGAAEGGTREISQQQRPKIDIGRLAFAGHAFKLFHPFALTAQVVGAGACALDAVSPEIADSTRRQTAPAAADAQFSSSRSEKE